MLTREETYSVLAHLQGHNVLMVSLLYGAGLRLLECARLRVKDVELERRQIVVRAGKGGRDRLTLLPESMLWLMTSMQEFKAIVEAYIQRRYGMAHHTAD